MQAAYNGLSTLYDFCFADTLGTCILHTLFFIWLSLEAFSKIGIATIPNSIFTAGLLAIGACRLKEMRSEHLDFQNSTF